MFCEQQVSLVDPINNKKKNHYVKLTRFLNSLCPHSQPPTLESLTFFKSQPKLQWTFDILRPKMEKKKKAESELCDFPSCLYYFRQLKKLKITQRKKKKYNTLG